MTVAAIESDLVRALTPLCSFVPYAVAQGSNGRSFTWPEPSTWTFATHVGDANDTPPAAMYRLVSALLNATQEQCKQTAAVCMNPTTSGRRAFHARYFNPNLYRRRTSFSVSSIFKIGHVNDSIVSVQLQWSQD
jgi:hypothetical protein